MAQGGRHYCDFWESCPHHNKGVGCVAKYSRTMVGRCDYVIEQEKKFELEDTFDNIPVEFLQDDEPTREMVVEKPPLPWSS